MITAKAAGLSHSEIRGSMAICALPRLIAAYHVLHRLHEPRHPPCALSYFLASRRYPYTINSIRTSLILSAVVLFICHRGPKGHDGRRFYSLACVNLSKIFVRKPRACRGRIDSRPSFSHGVENNGFEPLTPCLQSRCSSQLS